MSHPPDEGRFAWLGSVTGLLAVTACYGTLGAVALLSLIGVSVEINEGVMVKLISALLVLVLFGMSYSYRIHRAPGPLLLSLVSAGVLGWTFFGSYSKGLEMAGFALLTAASVWDFFAKKRTCAAKGCETAE